MSKLIHSVGKRKTSIARVWMKPGKGNFIINKRAIEDYYDRPSSKMMVNMPFVLTDTKNKYDVNVNVKGGGLSGQASAIRHALSKALVDINNDYRPILKEHGLLTRDARVKERKKPGQPGARKRYQYSKR